MVKDARETADSVVDLTNCDREPIHIPGSIQPLGLLLVISPDDRRVLQASRNCEQFLESPLSDMLNRPLREVLPKNLAQLVEDGFHRLPTASRPVLLGTYPLSVSPKESRQVHALGHHADGGIVLELELDGRGDFSEVHHVVDAFTLEAERAQSVTALCQWMCLEVRRLTGFDRVLIYRFADDWHGTVIGEDGNGRLPSYLHHRFPASDIPAQARELYRVNRLRMIPDAGYSPIPVLPVINPRTGRPLDMSFATLRSVSPIHLEYMRNMQTASSMSVSVMRGDRLWGLISCHHAEPHHVPFPIRITCELLARAFSLRLAALEHAEELSRRIHVRSVYSQLLGYMAQRSDFVAGLIEHPEELLNFVGAEGAACVSEGICRLVGATPSEAQVRSLVDWLFQQARQEAFATDTLSVLYPPAREFAETASGLLAIAVSKLHPSYVLWFRPEVTRNIPWGGDPHKAAEPGTDESSLQPRRSFATWQETVRYRSLPWQVSELDGATELRNAIVGIVLQRAEELAGLNAELTRSNQELEAFSYSVSHDLRAPLRHIVGYAEMLRESAGEKLTPTDVRCLNTIIESSNYAGKLVDKLLAHSRLGRTELQRSQVDMNQLVAEVREDVMREAGNRRIKWHIMELPEVAADLMMLRLALRNLLANALKYSRERSETVIEIGVREDETEYTFWVQDNGVGFDMTYVDKLFGVFQRLHRWEDYEGTGIGLANVRRVIDRHLGRTWAQGEPNRGATFFFTLPKSPK